ncbi:hypothetical protein [Desulfobacterium sp. N47]|uniref:Uncharacterized protein n=1 Tax=uncultured Desulfobacterium sp. TaxID=201089 RepID=E1YH70_9BACT|nr:unknown protein [uncultured Desulfobacterium sp.]
MRKSDLYFLEKVREFKKIEQEFIRFTYETKTPRSKEESEEFIKKSIGLSNNSKELAIEIKKRGNSVLHIKDTMDFSVRGLALKTIKDTVETIEHLYR